MASLFGVDPEKFKNLNVGRGAKSAWAFCDSPYHPGLAVPVGVFVRPMIGTSGKLWTCGRPGQMRCVGLTPEAAYRSWSRMQ